MKDPVVLGNLKKDKSSKPILVIIIFALLLSTCFGLPYIKDYINNNDNEFTRFYKSHFGSITDDTTTDTSVTTTKANIYTTLNKTTSLKYDTLTITNFVITGSVITYDIISSKIVILDEQNLYLEIYGSDSSLIGRVKLIGTYQKDTKISVSSSLVNFKLNASSTYGGKVVTLNTEQYPDVTISNDTLTCLKDDETYVYTFKNAALIAIDQKYNYKKSDDLTIYMDKLNKSNMKTALIKTYENCTSSTEENDTGFTFLATLDMTKIKRTNLNDYIDYNIYDLNTAPKTINYEMQTKGYKCT